MPRTLRTIVPLALLIVAMFGSLAVPRVKADPLTLDFNSVWTHNVEANTTYQIDYSLKVYIVTDVKFEIYGDLVQADGWTIKMNAPKSVLVKQTYYDTIDVTIPKDAKNGWNGFMFVVYVDSEAYMVPQFWINVTGGKDVMEKQPIYEHPECTYLIAENLWRDVYVPYYPPGDEGAPRAMFWIQVTQSASYQLQIIKDCGLGWNSSLGVLPPGIHTVGFSHLPDYEWCSITLNYSFVFWSTLSGRWAVEEWLNLTSKVHCPPEFPPLEEVETSAVTPDLNNNGKVDIFDMVILGNAYGAEPDDPEWNIVADLNRDDVVDIFDVVIVAGLYGKTM